MQFFDILSYLSRATTLQEWSDFTQENIDRARKELVSGRPLRSIIDQILKQVIEDLWLQYNTVNNAFRRRIDEYKEAKAKLENHHFEVSSLFYILKQMFLRLLNIIILKNQFMYLYI